MDNPRLTISAGGQSVEMTLADLDRAARGKPPVKNAPEDQAVSDRAYGVAAGELRQFIERAERLQSEIADLKADEKEVFAEAKSRGYDTKVMRKVIALRKRDKDDVAEEQAILELYLSALGM